MRVCGVVLNDSFNSIKTYSQHPLKNYKHLFNMKHTRAQQKGKASQWILQAYDIVGDFERRIHVEQSFVARLLLLPLLFALYIVLLGCLLFMIYKLWRGYFGNWTGGSILYSTNLSLLAADLRRQGISANQRG